MQTFTPTHKDSKLQSDWLYLHEQMPPAKWYSLPSFCTATTWLGMHHSLRRGQNEIEYLNQEFANGRLEWADYRTRLLNVADGHYGHLAGHHRLEDVQYFPMFRKIHPKLIDGFNVLDSDHHHIEQQLDNIQNLLNELRQSDVEKANPKLAEQLLTQINESGEWLYRHLTDEEDLVIPILGILEKERND